MTDMAASSVVSVPELLSCCELEPDVFDARPMHMRLLESGPKERVELLSAPNRRPLTGNSLQSQYDSCTSWHSRLQFYINCH